MGSKGFLGSAPPAGVVYTQLKGFEDLVRLVSLSPTPFLEHVNLDGREIYFVHTLTIFGPTVVYYVELRERIDKRYAVFNRYKDEITFSERLGTDPQAVYIPILEVERTNLFK